MKTVTKIDLWVRATILAALLAYALVHPAHAQQGTAPGKVSLSWLQQGKISGGVSVTSSSAPTALPASGFIAWVCNTGATNDAYVAFGGSAVAATVTGSSWLKAGTCAAYDLYPFFAAARSGYIAAITGSSTTTLTVETGSGTPPAQGGSGGGGGGGGSVTQGTVPWSDSVDFWNGIALGSPANYGTSPGAVKVPGVNAFVTNSVAVTGTFWQATQPVSGTFWPYTLGQQLSAASVPVTPASDPDSRPVSQNVTVIDSGSTTTAGYNSVNLVTGSPTAGSAAAQAVNGQSSGTITVTGTWTGTLTFEISGDGGTTWATTATRQRGSAGTLGPRTSTTTGNGIFVLDLSAMTNVRARATAAVTGTAVVKYDLSATSGPIQIQTPVSVYDNISNANLTVKPASTAPLATDPNVVVGFSPNGNNVGGYDFQISPTITVQNAAYSAGNSMGGLITLTGAARTNGGSGILDGIRLKSVGGATNTIWIYAWSKTPVATCTDKSAYVASATDNPFAIPGFPTSLTLGGSPGAWDTATYAQLGPILSNFKNQDSSPGTPIYFCMVTAGSVTPATTSDLSLVAGGVQD